MFLRRHGAELHYCEAEYKTDGLSNVVYKIIVNEEKHGHHRIVINVGTLTAQPSNRSDVNFDDFVRLAVTP